MNFENKSLPNIALFSDNASRFLHIVQMLNTDFHILTLSAKECKFGMLLNVSIDAILLDELYFVKPIDEVIKTIRSISSLENVPILVLTGKLKKDFLKKIIDSGANEVVREPLQKEDILHRIYMSRKILTMEKKLDKLQKPFAKMEKKISLKERLSFTRSHAEKIQKIYQKYPKAKILIVDLIIDSSINEETQKNIAKSIKSSIKETLPDKADLFRITPKKSLILLPVTTKPQIQEIMKQAEEFIETLPLGNKIELQCAILKEVPHDMLKDLYTHLKGALEHYMKPKTKPASFLKFSSFN